MQIVYFLVAVVGLAMFIWGSLVLIKVFKNKTISELDLTGKPNKIKLDKSGLYSICVVGGGYIKNRGNFAAEIKINDKGIPFSETIPKFRFRFKGRLATEYYKFKVKEVGEYSISIKNISDLEVKESMLFTKRLIQNKVPINYINLIVKRTTSNLRFISGLLMAIFGFNISGWGIILAFNPHIFN
ncbi:hypothetical protein [Psychroflexus aestuariivivens]|uniref:hypothetical protein n=1 Tax=Psychroflexus aestuariivivens TaxID=1795040 RepID=UPI000FDCC2BD|nr:hypothetical protein [Psychroflexus aestuariivivens]